MGLPKAQRGPRLDMPGKQGRVYTPLALEGLRRPGWGEVQAGEVGMGALRAWGREFGVSGPWSRRGENGRGCGLWVAEVPEDSHHLGACDHGPRRKVLSWGCFSSCAMPTVRGALLDQELMQAGGGCRVRPGICGPGPGGKPALQHMEPPAACQIRPLRKF